MALRELYALEKREYDELNMRGVEVSESCFCELAMLHGYYMYKGGKKVLKLKPAHKHAFRTISTFTSLYFKWTEIKLNEKNLAEFINEYRSILKPFNIGCDCKFNRGNVSAKVYKIPLDRFNSYNIELSIPKALADTYFQMLLEDFISAGLVSLGVSYWNTNKLVYMLRETKVLGEGYYIMRQ